MSDGWIDNLYSWQQAAGTCVDGANHLRAAAAYGLTSAGALARCDTSPID